MSETTRHPLALSGRNSGFYDRLGFLVNEGDFVMLADQRIAVRDEALHDGDALITIRGTGEHLTVKWNQLTRINMPSLG
jgi:hypothetical protein